MCGTERVLLSFRLPVDFDSEVRLGDERILFIIVGVSRSLTSDRSSSLLAPSVSGVSCVASRWPFDASGSKAIFVTPFSSRVLESGEPVPYCGEEDEWMFINVLQADQH